MLEKKGKCSVCGQNNDITAKVRINNTETLYCRECHEVELQEMLENFNKMKFTCVKCGSDDVTKDNSKTGILEDVRNINESVTDMITSMSARAFITCNKCKHKFHVNILDYGQT